MIRLLAMLIAAIAVAVIATRYVERGRGATPDIPGVELGSKVLAFAHSLGELAAEHVPPETLIGGGAAGDTMAEPAPQPKQEELEHGLAPPVEFAAVSPSDHVAEPLAPSAEPRPRLTRAETRQVWARLDRVMKLAASRDQ